jgi:hypothetical protein
MGKSEAGLVRKGDRLFVMPDKRARHPPRCCCPAAFSARVLLLCPRCGTWMAACLQCLNMAISVALFIWS